MNDNNENNTSKIDDIEQKKVEKKKLITFTKINKYFIFPFLSPIFIYIRDYFISLAKYKDDGLKATFQYVFMDSLMHSVCGIFYLISFLKSRTERQKIEDNNNALKNNLIKKNNEIEKKNNNKIKIFLIILFIAASYIVYVSNSKILLNKYNVLEIRIYHLVFNTIFCRIILKDSIYKHQLLSLILASIGWIFISIPIFTILTNNDIIPNIIFFFGAIFLPLYFVLFKFIIEKYFISPFLNMLFIGILLIFISVLGLFIFSFISCNNISYLKDLFDISENNNYFIIAFIFGIIVKIIFCFIINNFSPNIFVLTNIISSIISWISKLILRTSKDSKKEIIFKAIGYFIIFFSTLIYNEIIIFNFCGLNKNTTNDIEERAKTEAELLNQAINEKESIKDENNNLSKNDTNFFEVDEYIIKNPSQKNLENE